MFPPDHYEAIGRLVIACTRLDAIMTDLICGATGMQPNSALITVHHQTFSSKIDTLKALLDARNPIYDEVPNRLVDLINEAKRIYDYRSTLVHAAWVAGDSGSPSTERITARGKLVKSKRHQPTRKIREYADQADAITVRLEAERVFF